mmetsp:Transcript_45614/g.87701  ORF Transcript_45614/g.87701 Transcript_45614/m.87701 type:complete len:373 (-) Transcript_45614:5-1123(-)
MISTLARFAASLCERQPIITDSRQVMPYLEVASTDSGHVMPHVVAASIERGDIAGCPDQPASTCGTATHLQSHPSCDVYRSDQAKEGDQEVKEVAVNEDAVSTEGVSSPEHSGDAASVDSDAVWNTASSSDVTSGPGPAALSEHVETAADAATEQQAIEAEEFHQNEAGQAIPQMLSFNDAIAQAQEHLDKLILERGDGDLDESQLDNAPPMSGTAGDSPSFKLELSALNHPGASAAAAAAEPRDGDEATEELEVVQAAAAQIEQFSARIVGRSGKFYNIELHSTRLGDSNLAPLRKLTKRYREFAVLDMELRPRHQALPTLPPKSVFVRRTFKQNFMDDREQRLGAYLSALMADPSAVAEPSVRSCFSQAC